MGHQEPLSNREVRHILQLNGIPCNKGSAAGYKYVDFYKALSIGNATSTGQNTNLFFASNVHPNSDGHVAMFNQVVADAPYLFASYNNNINPFGSIGIATTTPQEALHVVGNIRMDGGTAQIKLNGTPIFLATTTRYGIYAGTFANAPVTTVATNNYNAYFGMSSNSGAGVTTGIRNAVFGSFAGEGNGSYNTVIGALAMRSASGQYNTAVGYEPLFKLSSGTNNVSVGADSFLTLLTGSYNTALGNNAGTGEGCYLTCDYESVIDTLMTFIGYNASRGNNVASTSALTNSSAFGANAKVGASNAIVFGNGSVTIAVGSSTPMASSTMVIQGNTQNATTTVVYGSPTKPYCGMVYGVGGTITYFYFTTAGSAPTYTATKCY